MQTASPRSANYGIKGYLYQFCKTIEEILRLSPQQKITIEGIEDIDIHSSTGLHLFQCKYHEEQNFSPSKVYQPIGQMIMHYLENEAASIAYRLYVYFSNNTPSGNDWITSDILEKSLKKINQNITATEMQFKNFSNNFKFSIGHKFEDLVKLIKSNLCSTFSCSLDEVEHYYYNNSIAYIAQISAKKNQSERTITQEIFKHNVDKKINLFDIWQKKYSGTKIYIRTIKNHLKNERALNNDKRRYLFIDSSLIKTNKNILSAQFFLKNLSEQYPLEGSFYNTNPWTIIIDAAESELKKIKAYLIENKIYYNDGYEDIFFCEEYFNNMPIINTKGNSSKISRASHSLRIISATTFKKGYRKIIDDDKYPHIFLDTSRKEDNRAFLNSDKTMLYMLSALDNLSELSEILKK